MQSAVRSAHNQALAYAVQEANRLKVPVLAVFGLTPSYPAATARHYLYLLQGVRDARAGLQERGVPLLVGLTGVHGPAEAALALAPGAALIVTERGYLRQLRAWRAWLTERLAAQHADLPFVEVESELVVPVGVTSVKQEYAARTIRPRIHRALPQYLTAYEDPDPQHHLRDVPRPTELEWLHPHDLKDPAGLVRRFGVQGVPPGREEGGEVAAQAQLRHFLTRLDRYDRDRNDPTLDGASGLSAHLHYGQLSALQVALAVQDHGGPGVDAYLEELVVRRELSFNLCWYSPHYDTFEVVPDWARRTLQDHRHDERRDLYTPDELEAAATHDPYWNAAQRQMTATGRMHNYLRMYWGKKVLEWTPDPEQAHATLVRLNDRYEQDGRDPNSYAGIGWVFGLHDRPWTRRPIFGTVRYMNAAGLKRKFDIETYARRWNGPQGDPDPTL
ncbi:deoxyribodipyrimidine photo-lyase [Deinococcus aquiradiocola]|uniref:Deoxyribodipyrimidine photo-lyase n=2 Tax=Deinococcus aquiradiocola TaxID=393059 RepID=A0A917PRM1_9DEIO|nr:deoxyribodipyrimidine photo-lyase [Deinococcus aquiradiocola]